MREVARLLPHENLIYLGDTAHLPYGNKSPQTVLQFALENSSFLMGKNIKLLVVACHTASSHALRALQNALPIPVIGVIQPGVELVKPFRRIAILGTTSTIESGVYQSLILEQNPEAIIYPKACPLFVPLIEEGFYNHPAAALIARAYLEPLQGQIDAALLACTHYPLIRSILQDVLGPAVVLLEPAAMCASLVKSSLAQQKIGGKPSYEFYATDDPEKFRRFGNIFFGSDIEKVEKK